MKVNDNGVIYYYNKLDRLHRLKGPAVIYLSGSNIWYKNGKKHRVDKPAAFYYDEYEFYLQEWWYEGFLHREDGPAVEWANGSKEYWVNGLLHREDGPAIISIDLEYNELHNEYWLNDIQYDFKEYNYYLLLKKLDTP